MRKAIVAVGGLVLLLGLTAWLPAQPQPQGFTIEDIYYYLAEGIEPSWGAHSLEPQSGQPGQDIPGFSRSLEDIYYYMAAALGACTLAPEDFADSRRGLSGKRFFSTDASSWGVYQIPAPSPSPVVTPPPDLIAEIGGLHVARWTNNAGTASNATQNWWYAVDTWAEDLDWLGKSDWRLPTKDELVMIYQSRGALGTYAATNYWSSTQSSSTHAWNVYFSNGNVYSTNKTSTLYVRAVRAGE